MEGPIINKLLYQWVFIGDRLVYVSDPVEIWGTEYECVLPTTTSITMDEDRWLHVLAVRYIKGEPEQSVLHYFAMRPLTAAVNDDTQQFIHLERQPGRPNRSEHILGTDIEFSPPGTILAVWDQHDDIPPPNPDPDDHDVFFNRSTDGGYTWLTSDESDGTPILISNPDFIDDYYHELKPRILVDNSDDQRLWVVFQRPKRGSPQTRVVLFSTSADGGDTWSEDAMLITPPPRTA